MLPFLPLFIFLTAGLTAAAQPVSFGAKFGAPLKDPSPDFSHTSAIDGGRWSGGPTIELHLPFRFSVEVDALYTSYRKTTTFPAQILTTLTNAPVPELIAFQSRTKSWEVPLLLKYRFAGGPIRPFISAGVSLTEDFGTQYSSTYCLAPGCSTNRFFQSDFSQFRKGPTAGAGFDLKLRRHITMTPEARYRHLDQPRGNQVTAMLGFTFGR